MLLRSSVITSVYDKSLRLNTSARSKYTSGQINNLMSVDGMKLQNLTVHLQTIWSGPFQIIVSLILLWFQLGWATFGGVAVIVLMIPLSGLVAKMLEHFQVLIMRVKDERIKSLNEVLNGIKIIKLQVWEKNFVSLITKLRLKELGYLLKYILFILIIFLFNIIEPHFSMQFQELFGVHLLH